MSKTIRFLGIFQFIFTIIVSVGFAQNTQDTTKVTPKLKYYSKSPALAMLLSTLFPGGGQFYTENYLKGIIFLGAEGALGYYAYQDHQNYQRTSESKYRDRRNNLLWWIASVKILSIADAYVSANLYKFNEMMRLSVDIKNSQISFSIKTKY
ncbi:MAG: DUF5683 domain-containing protein [candidate division WOR-3 bacterium]|nr:DUF5683 domain-containing protein [candidate division WOR-3 bacterium]